MDIDVFPSNELDTVFRALRTALDPSPATGKLGLAEQTFLDTFARITGHPLAATPPTIAPREVHIETPHARKRLVQLAATAALLHRPVRAVAVTFVSELASALAVDEPVIPVLRALSRGQRGRARLLTARRGLAALLKEAYVAEGPWGVLRFVTAVLFRARVNRDKLTRYKRLGLLPEGTLGREYWRHLTELGYGFPGEPAGIPESVAYHDIAHVLADHDTTPSGEMQQGSFQAGNRRDDGFFFLQFVLLQFHHGIQLTPVAAPEVGYFEPAKVLWAIHRGATCNVDVTHQWNFWPLMPLPLDEARARCELLPKPAS